MHLLWGIERSEWTISTLSHSERKFNNNKIRGGFSPSIFFCMDFMFSELKSSAIDVFFYWARILYQKCPGGYKSKNKDIFEKNNLLLVWCKYFVTLGLWDTFLHGSLWIKEIGSGNGSEQ